MSIIDKTIRIILGFTILIYFGLFYPTWWSLLGLIPLISGVNDFCPIYKLLKKGDKQTKEKKDTPKEKKDF
ncbi:DUF2892 domain-containing protein [Campylobacter blaseri]|uniref:Inner membrane protein YgaP-like transmembrane domain-containing protein n=1 Tax=Campylobacter blaseri TaxID=2042961 RepID=A0A2P8R447_9BACT|nr:DUF2892 domain-containing protein [Campylobacter blaseri]PSM53287.1 hypothetical protein CQ405_01715 [Campylobacter blaseri]PSM54753.1 hypothetical protein CRN67_01715 [Campylobacter blaseri]QKF86765.1 DUF2892 domain-containing protein [Campylobacter blaseri]